MTAKELEGIVRGIAPGIVGRIKTAIVPLDTRMSELELRLARVENRKGVAAHYEGIHDADCSYSIGSLVTKRGGLWLALRDTSETPGSGTADHWRLIVKSGHAE
jgi:hypothetical protein